MLQGTLRGVGPVGCCRKVPLTGRFVTGCFVTGRFILDVQFLDPRS